MNRIKVIIIFFLLALLVIPILINLALFLHLPVTPSDLGNTDWLSFWGSFLGGAIGGIGTLLAVYFTIKHYEEQNEKNKSVIKNLESITKINSMLEQISDRDPIPNSSYSYKNEFKDIKEKIEKYNLLQGRLISYFTNIAMGVFISLFYFQDEDGNEIENNLINYFKIPDDVKKYAFIVGKLALYENCSELIRGNAELGHVIEKEVGGSYGMWHLHLHEFRNDGDDDFFRSSLEEFFSIIPSLAKELEELKNNLSIN